MSTSDKSDGLTGQQKSSGTLQEFAIALGDELDVIGYDASAGRSAALAERLGVGRTQAYRLLKGVSGPSVETLATLRSLGVSLDRLFDNVNGQTMETRELRIGEEVVSVMLQEGFDRSGFSAVAVPEVEGGLTLRILKTGEVAPSAALPIRSLQFPFRYALAIVEDDDATRELLCAEMASSFRVSPFAFGNALVNLDSRAENFDAYLVDWRLPDITGTALVRAIRARTGAPIFILSGDTGSSAEIANALNSPNVHHVAKPADALILRKKIYLSVRQSKRS